MRANPRKQTEISGEREYGWRSNRGQILVMFAAALLLFMGMIALAVDAGFIMAERRQVQSAADAGAMAAAKAKLDYLYESDIITVQEQTGKRYGATNAETVEDNVTVDPDPDMDGFDDVYVDGVNRYVEVTVSKDVESFFLRALYDGEWGVSSSAIAGMEPVPRPYALLALDCGLGSNGGINVDGSGTINVELGSIMSNCGITTSGNAGGSEVIAAVAIDAYGLIEEGPDWCGGDDCSEINENRPKVSDPVVEEGIQPPSESAARAVREVIDDESMRNAITNLDENHSNPYRCPSNGTNCVMQPGYYGGGLSGISVRGTLQMEPGIYYFDDNFVINGHSENTVINGSEVLLYFTGNSAFQPKHATIDLSAAGTVGDGGCEAALDAMAVWIENGSPFRMQSNGTFKLDGVFYGPESDVRLYGGNHSNSMQIIVKSLELSGGNDFGIEFLDCFEGTTPYVFLVQ